MKKAILSLVTATAVGAAGLAAAPQPAHAVWWIVPAIIGGAAVGVGVGAAADNAAHQQYAYEPHGSVYVRPTADCRIVRERIDGQWRRMQVCD